MQPDKQVIPGSPLEPAEQAEPEGQQYRVLAVLTKTNDVGPQVMRAWSLLFDAFESDGETSTRCFQTIDRQTGGLVICEEVYG